MSRVHDEGVRTPEGAAATELVLATFRLNGLLVAAGDLLAAEQGLTSARWQVMGAIALADRPLTVPQIARRMGLTRQAVQASVNRMLDEGLLESKNNPDHRRSPHVQFSARGRRTYAALQRRQASWVNELATGLERSDLDTALRVLQELSARLEPRDG